MNYRYYRGSQVSAESVEFDITSQNGNYKTTCSIIVDLLICGISTFPCADGDDEELTLTQQLDILKLVQEERGKIIHKAGPKSLEDWENSGLGTFEDYFIPGDTVTEDLVEYFVNIMPPTTMRTDLIQIGEPFSHELDDGGCYRPTYNTFCKRDGVWWFVGWCFAQELTNRVTRASRLAERLNDIEKVIRKAEQ